MSPGTVEAISIVAFFVAIVGVVKIISESLVKRKLLASHLSEDAIREYLKWSRAATREDALKWGLIWIGIGLALVLIDVLPFDLSDPIAYGLIFVLGGAGLLLYRTVASGRAADSGERQGP